MAKPVVTGIERGHPSWGPEGCPVYLTDFGPVYFRPGTTKAQVKAIKDRVRRLVHERWNTGESYPFFWHEKMQAPNG